MNSRTGRHSAAPAGPARFRTRRGLLTPFRAWRELRRVLRESEDTLMRAMRTSKSGSLVHLEALEYLTEHAEAVPQSQLQEALGLSQSSTSRLVTRLEAQGLVRRSNSSTDARAALIDLTAAGSETASIDIQHFAPLIRGELRTLTKALLPATAPGAESLLLPNEVDGEGEARLEFGQSVFTLARATAVTMEAMAIRESLEELMLTDASQHWEPPHMAGCRAILQRMEAAMDEPEEFFRADWSLHRHLLGICQNRLLQQVYGALLSVIEDNLEAVVPTSGLDRYLVERLDVHTQLVEAVASGNTDLVRAAAHRHAYTGRSPVRSTG